MLFFSSAFFLEPLFLVSAYCNGRHWENSTKIISTGLAGVPGRDAYWMGEYTQVIHPISNSTGRSWVNNAVCYKVLLTGRTENLSNQRKQIMSFRQLGFSRVRFSSVTSSHEKVSLFIGSLHFSLSCAQHKNVLNQSPHDSAPPWCPHTKKGLVLGVSRLIEISEGHQLRKAKGSSTIDFINLAFPQPSHELALYEPAFQNRGAVKAAWPNTRLNSAWAKSQSSPTQQKSPLFLSPCKNTDHPVNLREMRARERETANSGRLLSECITNCHTTPATVFATFLTSPAGSHALCLALASFHT